MGASNEVLRDMHSRMVRIRLFEEAAGRLFEAGGMPGFIHLYVGQGAVAAGVCAALRPDDQISSTHRGHGHLVAKGGDLHKMMAELMGKATGYCKGKGGSMHISELELNMLGANGIVGGGVPIAVGAGFANKYRGTDTVSAVFFGDGATNIGAFHEAANMFAGGWPPRIRLATRPCYSSRQRWSACRACGARSPAGCTSHYETWPSSR